MNWLYHKAEAIRNMAVNRDEIPAWLKTDLVCYYTGKQLNGWNNATDKKWFDSSGNGRHMDMVNLAYTGTSNLDGNGFDVDGVDDYGSIADSAATRLTAGGTLMAWIKPASTGEIGDGRIIDKSANANGGNGYFLAQQPLGKLYANINGGANIIITDTNAITYGRWQMIAFTFNSIGRALYNNAVNVTLTGGAETALPPNAAGIVAIGNRAGATDRTFDGQIDKPRIIKRVLTQAEIMQIFQNERRFYGV